MACTIRGVEMTEPAAKPKRRRVNDPRNHVPTAQTRAAVWMMSATGVTLENIGLAMGVHKVTIARHYKQELDRGVAASLFKLATTPGPSQAVSCMFWLKTRGKWQEIHKTEVSGAGGGQLIIYSGALAQHDETM
jgi:hypothetical protein